jgi:MscS family membrane protein
VSRIPELYAEHGYGPLGELLPASMFEVRFLEIQLWQWIGLVALVLVAYLLSWVGALLLQLVARPIVARTRTVLDDQLLGLMLGPLRLILSLVLFTLGSLMLRFSVPVYRFLGGLEKAVAVLAITWVALRVVDIITALFNERLVAAGRVSAVAVLPLGRRTVKVFIIALALIAVLQNLGFQVTGLIAGLGVGGLAVALAAQKSIENLFGGVTIIADQPVRVGDFCRFGDKIGTIEEIGLRSTRIRTLDRTRITVPNSQFSEIHVENFALRDKVRLFTMLGLRYETTPDQLRYVLTGLREVLVRHPSVGNDPARVRLVAFGAHSLDLEVFAYVMTSDWAEFCAIREDLYLRFMDVVNASGTGFAFPSQTLYLGRDGGMDEGLSRAAEAQVQHWREEGRLPFPDFAQQAIDEMDGTSDYPPAGSVRARAGGERFPEDGES